MRQARSEDTRKWMTRREGGQTPTALRCPRAVIRLAIGVIAVSIWAPGAKSLMADVVHLKNGQHVEGEVTEGEDGKTRVTIDDGVFFEFPPSEIERIERKKSPSATFDERLAKIDGRDLDAIDALTDLASWARTRRLRSRVRKAFRRVLEIDPHHAEARRGLGYVVLRNRWVHEKDLKGQKDLVQFGDEWMTPDEKERRLLDRLNRQLREDFRGVVSDNRFVQDYSIRRLLERVEPGMRGVLAEFLNHPSSVARVVAVQALARTYKPGGTGKKKCKKQTDTAAATARRAVDVEARVAAGLLKMTLEENERDVRRALHLALIDIRQRAYFELALKAATESPLKLHRDRAADGILYDISKPWVSEVIEALRQRPPVGTTATSAAVARNESILRILKRMFPVDLGFGVEEWRAWWRDNQAKYRDES
jgi:hypothetical protein